MHFPQTNKDKKGKEVHLNNSTKRDLEQLEFLKKHVSGLYREFMIEERSDKLAEYLKKFDGKTFDRSSAQYLITFDKQLQIKEVEILRRFTDAFDRKLITFIKKNIRWEKLDYFDSRDEEIENGTKHVLGIYYYSDGDKFLSTLDL